MKISPWTGVYIMMIIRYIKHIKNKNILEGIMKLLILCNNEFVPPLTLRNSTTQRDFASKQEDSSIPCNYFKNIINQQNFVALENGKVVGFMSFKQDYISSEIPPSMTPNVYISTVIVHPLHRNKGITNKFYSELFIRFVGYHIFTRTWSTNSSHIRILSSHKFYEYCRIKNDRGKGIDTVYYHRSPINYTKSQIIRQYRLTGNFVFLSLLIILTITFIVAWLLTERGIMHELFLAFSTSLIASALCLFSDSILKYRESKNDEYILTLKSFGIENLQFHKDELLERIIPKCKNEIWISGYRLIMTAKASFMEAIVAACKKHTGIKIKVLTVAPWSETFRLVYGNEDVTNNYFKVFYTLCCCMQDYGCQLEIRMTDKPIFNDTYKVDNRFVTGPYLHCINDNDQKITAKDFFSLDINDPKKDLYNIIYKDYMAVWNSAFCKLDCASFQDIYFKEKNRILTFEKTKKIDLLKNSCRPLDYVFNY